MKRMTTKVYLAVCSAIAAPAAFAQTVPTDLIVSGTTYQDVGQVSTLQVGSLLPGSNPGSANSVAVAGGQYNQVFLNDGADGDFGVTSQIFLQNFSNGSQVNINAGSLVGSFSSKSELAINVSSDGSSITFSGYNPTQSYSSTTNASGTGINAVTTGGNNNLGLLDISNANTPGVIDPTNGDTGQAFRSVGQVSIASLLGAANNSTLGSGSGLSVTNTNAYSGNNGRAVVLLNGQYYYVGNAGNSGSSPKPTGATLTTLSMDTGVQTITPGSSSANSTVVGACSGTSGSTTGFQCGFNIASTGVAADKTGKDDNFRGLTTFGGNLYVSKGSGSNGVNTVYEVSGLGNPATATVSILPGFPTSGVTATPFGMWFANANTLYVASEGGDAIAGANGALPNEGGITKYTLSNNVWKADYTINTGGSFTGAAVGADTGSTTFYTDGIRNLTGKVNADGTVTLYGVTSTVTDAGAGGNWDQGANPDQVVTLTDTLAATTAGSEAFTALETSAEGTAYRGVALAPVPVPMSGVLLLSGIGGLLAFRRKRAAV